MAGKYKYRVTGPRGGKYLTTTRREAEKLTRNGGTIRALGQKKASKVKNPDRPTRGAFSETGLAAGWMQSDAEAIDEAWGNNDWGELHRMGVISNRDMATIKRLMAKEAAGRMMTEGEDEVMGMIGAKVRRAVDHYRAEARDFRRHSNRNPGIEILWGGGGQGFIKGEIPGSHDLFTIEKAHLTAPWVLKFYEDGRMPPRVLDYGNNANKLKKAAQRYVDTVADHVPTLAKYRRNPDTRIDSTLRGLLEAALWSSSDEDDEPLDSNYSIYDIDEDSLGVMSGKVAKWEDANYDLIERAMYSTGQDYEQLGHDLWLTSAGHGAGFWDGDWDPYGDELTDAAKEFGEKWVYVGDDGKLHFQ